MKISLTLDDQPLAFLRRQPPEARQALRAALHAVEAGEREPVALEGELDGFYKVRVGSYRLVLAALPGAEGPRYRVIFAEKRDVVYVLFAELLGLGE